jgi:L-malate glycosyltransferase
MRLMKFVTAFGLGGTERHFVNLALSLDASRFDVHFGCLRRWGQLLEPVEARHIPVFEYGVTTFRSLKALRAQWRMARDIRRNRIEIVHTYNFYANVFAILPAKLAGARVIASIRDMGAYLSPAQRRAQRFACRLADQILVNATAIRDWLVADGYRADRIVVIPNGIEVARFENQNDGTLREELNVEADAPLVGVAGRVTPLKGIEDFLMASAHVARRFPKVRFVIVGDSLAPNEQVEGRRVGTHDERPRVGRDPVLPYMDRLREQAAALGIADRVIFMGYRSDVERILTQLTIAVQPSLSEGLSNSLLEPMAAGLPVVATRVGGAGEVLRDGENGLLVAPSHPDELAGAIARLLESPDLGSRLGTAARRTIVESYSMARMVERTSHVYES